VIHAQADRTRLRQVLMNLLSNAIKYNRPAGSVTLRLALDGDGVLIAVADTGRGFSPEQLQRIYEPFNRLGAENDLTPGTGIGLVITRRLVELMNGTIELRTEPGRGAEFIVRLPRASAAPQPAAAAAKGESAPTAKHRRRTLLYVEDNPSNVDLLAGVLTMRPHLHMVAASDGATGLAQARVLQPDLIVLDIALPDVDGYEVCRQLRADGALAARPIIALSANAMPADITRGSEAGFDAYLTKPLDVPQFLAHLDRLLRD
jgi:CheY-like chemotaxis protein/anti-sigma regulatory factor (Ser/Thr protein kinase)